MKGRKIADVVCDPAASLGGHDRYSLPGLCTPASRRTTPLQRLIEQDFRRQRGGEAQDRQRECRPHSTALTSLQFYCGILGMRLVRTTRTPDGRRHYNVDIGGGNAFAVFDGAGLPMPGERQHVNHLALPVDTSEEFDAAYQRLKDQGVAVTEIIERGYGKTFYFHDPNGIRLQIELKTKQDADSLEGDPDPVPYVHALRQRT